MYVVQQIVGGAKWTLKAVSRTRVTMVGPERASEWLRFARRGDAEEARQECLRAGGEGGYFVAELDR